MLTLQYIRYAQIKDLSHEQRINKLLDLISEDKILLVEGRLRKEEETELIARTMEEIEKSESNSFKGIELCTIDSTDKSHQKFLTGVRNSLANLLLGDRSGMTIIGPASVVKEIKQDPEKIELFINNLSRKNSGKKNGKGSKRKK